MSGDLARLWLAGILGVSVQFTVLVIVVAAFVFVLPSLPPRVRYLVWLCVLLRLSIPMGVASPFGAIPPSLVPARVADLPGNEQLSTIESAGTSTARERLAGSKAQPPAEVSPALLLFAGWAGVVLCLSVIHVARSARRRVRIRSAMTPPPAKLVRQIEVLRAEVGLHRPVSAWVVQDDALGGPAIQGSLKPRILLPSSLVRSWPAEELEPVLLHELIHLKRKDPWARAFGNLLQIAYFFHPVVWWVNRRLREERENACDDAVIDRRFGAKRVYLQSLLRLVEERSPALPAAELRMATARRPLARRLRRMLHPRYHPNPKVGVFAFSILFLGMGLGLALSTEARGPATARVEQSGQIRGRLVWVGAYFVESVDEIADAERVEIGGDFTVGQPATPVKPNAEELATEHPELFRRLEALGRLSAKLIIDREGRVRNVRFEGEVDEELREPFLDVLRAARFEPTIHRERGPAVVEMQVDYLINPPPSPPSLYEDGRPLEGREVAEIVRAVPDGNAEELVPVRDGLPRYVAILDKGEPPLLEAAGEEIILSFGVSIDAQGNVERAGLFRDSRTGPNENPESTPESEALIPYLETFRLEPLVLGDGSPARGTAMIDVRVSTRGVEIATRAAASDEELDRRLADVYRLADDRSVDLRPPPHPPERMLLYRTGSPAQARVRPGGPTRMLVLWKNSRPTYGGACFGCDDLQSLLENLGVRRDAVRFEAGAENVHIEADVVLREGAPMEELLAGLSEVLRQRFGMDLRFERISETTKALVLRGSIGTVPPDVDRDGQRVLQVFTDVKDEDSTSAAGGGPFLNAAVFVELLSSQLGMPVIDETTGEAPHPFHVRIHRSAYATKRLDLLIRNVESQTDLDVVIEDRLVPRVVVSMNPP